MALLRAVADAYDENRAKFPFGMAEFEFGDGFATSVEAAARGEMRDRQVAKGKFRFDDKVHAYFEKRFPLEALFATTSWDAPDHASSRLDSQRMLTNGKVTFEEQISSSRDGKDFVYGHIITPGTSNFFRMAEFPLRLGWTEESRDDLAQHLRMVLGGSAGTGVESIEPDALLDGVKMVKISLRFPNGVVRYWVDLERGAIPVLRHDEIQGGFTFDVVHGGIRLVEGHGWLPFEKTVFVQGGRVKRLAITLVDFDARPPREAFQLEIENERGIANVAAGVSYKPRKRWDLDNLPNASGPDATPLSRSPAMAKSEMRLPGERDPGRPYYTIGGIAIAVLIGLVFIAKRLRG